MYSTNEILEKDDVPVLILPKTLLSLDLNGNLDNMYIQVNVSCVDMFGKDCPLYSGQCVIKVVESYSDGEQHITTESLELPSSIHQIDHENNYKPFFPMYDERYPNNNNPYYESAMYNNTTDIWINPQSSRRNYYENNLKAPIDNSGNPDVRPSHVVVHCNRENKSKTVQTLQQVQTVIHYENDEASISEMNNQEVYQYSQPMVNIETNTFHTYSIKNIDVRQRASVVHTPMDYQNNMMADCGTLLSQLPDQIVYENAFDNSFNLNNMGNSGEGSQSHSALKQLMSSNIQSKSKQRKTILFLGHNAERGHTLQKTYPYDRQMLNRDEPTNVSMDEVMDTHNAFPSDTSNLLKKYQCTECNEIFIGMSTYKYHILTTHSKPFKKRVSNRTAVIDNKYFCDRCGKKLKNLTKLIHHWQSHGNPDLECQVCLKIFASKSSLKQHGRLHSKNHPFRCEYCNKDFSSKQVLNTHMAKKHEVVTEFSCTICETNFKNNRELKRHLKIHSKPTVIQEAIPSLPVSMPDITDCEQVVLDVEYGYFNKRKDEQRDEEEMTNDMMAKRDVFNESYRILGRQSKLKKKECNVCFKNFDRMGDLKRHLIEHIVQSNLRKSLVDASGKTVFQCEVCLVATFNKIDKFKAHLREHAKLTLYQCTFCNKSFADSSNFSKHKKVHGVSYLQCDLCKRKFNSKKMIAQHMDYHSKNKPLPCSLCDKIFHFESNLKKHMKFVHRTTNNNTPIYICKICNMGFSTLKLKWDHEWLEHRIRKNVVDCQFCQTKFRKYSELRTHAKTVHGVVLSKMSRVQEVNCDGQ